MMKSPLLERSRQALDHMWVRILICIFAPVFLFGILLVSQKINPITAYATILGRLHERWYILPHAQES